MDVFGPGAIERRGGPLEVAQPLASVIAHTLRVRYRDWHPGPVGGPVRIRWPAVGLDGPAADYLFREIKGMNSLQQFVVIFLPDLERNEG